MGVWGSDANNVWAVGGPDGMIWKWNGTIWLPQTSGARRPVLYGVCGTRPKTVWVLGGDQFGGAILQQQWYKYFQPHSTVTFR
jgi:hypothetical protein